MTIVPNTLIGQGLERTEDLRFLTGTGTFVDDYEPAGTLHAAILRSSVAHGRIIELNKNTALKIPGFGGARSDHSIPRGRSGLGRRGK